jgi:hypothetical protein
MRRVCVVRVLRVRRLQETGENSDLYWSADRVKKVGLGGARGTNGESKNCGRKKLLGRPRCRCEDYIKVNLKEIGRRWGWEWGWT